MARTVADVEAHAREVSLNGIKNACRTEGSPHMPDITFTFDSASAYGAMLTKQQLNMNRLIDQLGRLGLDAHELLADMHRHAGVSDEEADVRGAQVAKPVAHIRDGLEAVRTGLGVLRWQLMTASLAMEEAEKRHAAAASRLKI